MLYSYPFWCQNFGWKYGTKICKRVGRCKGDAPGMDILTVGKESLPKLDVDCEGGS